MLSDDPEKFPIPIHGVVAHVSVWVSMQSRLLEGNDDRDGSETSGC
jgi:hypothetical protein